MKPQHPSTCLRFEFDGFLCNLFVGGVLGLSLCTSQAQDVPPAAPAQPPAQAPAPALPAVQASPPPVALALPLPDNEPVLGLWGVMVPGLPEGLCAETYRYLPDGTSLEQSGPSQTRSQWRIAAQAGANGFRPMTVRILQNNRQRDCGQNLPPLNRDFNLNARVHPSGNWMELCAKPTDPRTCMVLWRLNER